MSEQPQGLGLNLWFDPETRALYAGIEPEANPVEIDEAGLQARFAEMGWSALRQSPEAVAELLAQYKLGVAVKALRLAECIDASLAIAISADGLEATLDIEPAQGGAPIQQNMVLDALKSQGITEGIMLDAIVAALTAGEAHALPIARGRPPLAGADGWLESLLPATRSRAPKIDEFGHTDYRDLGDILAVHPGEALMLRHPPEAGVAGITVLGMPIPAKAGKDVQFANNLTGTALAPDDSNRLLTSIVGQPVAVPGGMLIEPVFALESVNSASGNIHFDGSVLIKGDILAGMTVQASGDIEVGGVVEAASLDAGGNIVIKGGAIGDLGHKERGRHVLRCKGSFSAGYASQARIEAGDSIFIDDTAMQCELSAVNCIRVGNMKRGHIIGGLAQATFSITAKVIGSPKRVLTRFEIGVNPVLHAHLQELVKSREAKEAQLFELSKVLDFARKNPARMLPEALEKARNTAALLASAIEEIRAEQMVLEEKIEISRQSRVIAEQAIYEGVEVSLGGRQYKVSGEHGAGAIGLGEQGAGLLPLDESPGDPMVE